MEQEQGMHSKQPHNWILLGLSNWVFMAELTRASFQESLKCAVVNRERRSVSREYPPGQKNFSLV